MRLRRLAIRAASGSLIGRPNTSTHAVARLKPRRQDPRDRQRTSPRLPRPNPRRSACGRALGTSVSLWRAVRPSKRAVPQWDGGSAQTSPARLSALLLFAPLAASKPTHRRIFGAAAAPPLDSPRREVAPQGRRQRCRRGRGDSPSGCCGLCGPAAPVGARWCISSALACLGRRWPKTGPEGWRTGAGKASRPCLVENLKTGGGWGMCLILLPPPPARRSWVHSAAWAQSRKLRWAFVPGPVHAR